MKFLGKLAYKCFWEVSLNLNSFNHMCYYSAQKVSNTEFIRLLNLEKKILHFEYLDSQLKIGFDYGLNTVLIPTDDKKDFDIVQMEWGFIPHYLKTREDVNKMRLGFKDETGIFHPPLTTLNAKSEELLKPGKMFRDATINRRCLVISSGFFEWRHVHPKNKKTGLPLKTAEKYPYFIKVKDHSYFYMAGIYQSWTDRETGEYINTFAIITTEANTLMSQIHNTKLRMPTILEDSLAYEWLFADIDENRIQEIAQTKYHSEEMIAYPIAKNFRELAEPSAPFTYEDLPELESIQSLN